MSQNERSEGEGSANQHQQPAILPPAPFAGQQTFSLTLPIPAPNLYWDNYYNPHFPDVLPRIVCYADMNTVVYPFSFPQPVGPLPAHLYDVLGAKLHDFGYVNNHPEKLFTKWGLWYIEINDRLLRLICPSDLNDAPCEWDELQGGCPMLRLCQMKHKYPHPHLGELPTCVPERQQFCTYIHDVQPTCRSIARALCQSEGEVVCERVASGRGCKFGHDFESTRAEIARLYWQHRGEARERGSLGWVKRDVWGRKLLRPIRLVQKEEV